MKKKHIFSIDDIQRGSNIKLVFSFDRGLEVVPNDILVYIASRVLLHA